MMLETIFGNVTYIYNNLFHFLPQHLGYFALNIVSYQKFIYHDKTIVINMSDKQMNCNHISIFCQCKKAHLNINIFKNIKVVKM